MGWIGLRDLPFQHISILFLGWTSFWDWVYFKTENIIHLIIASFLSSFFSFIGPHTSIISFMLIEEIRQLMTL